MSSLDSTPPWAAPAPASPARAVRVRTRVRTAQGRRRHRRRIRNRILFATFMVMALLGAAAAYLYFGPVSQAMASMKDAEQQVAFVQNQVKGGVAGLDASKLGAMQTALTRARQDVRDVQSLANQYSPLLDAARHLPYAGSRVTNGQTLLRVADHALDALSQIARVVVAVAPAPHGAPAHASSARAVLLTLSRYRPTLQSALAAWRQSVALAQPLPRVTDLGGSADHVLALFDQRADAVTELVGTMLDLQAVTSRGATYLLVSQNPEEQRATGGFIGFAALLHVGLAGVRVDHYQVSAIVDRQYTPGLSNLPLPSDSVPAPLPASYYANWEAWLFRDGNWSPDFRVSSRQLEHFYRRGQAISTDGVIAVEPHLLARLLAVTGPVVVPGTGVTLTANTALTQLHYTEYVLNNKQFTLQAWQAIMSHLLNMRSTQLFRVAEALGKALNNSELLAYANDPTLEARLGRHGLDGAVTQGRADYLYVVDTNLGYTKTDPFIRRGVVDRVVPLPDGSLVHNLTITYVNTLLPTTVLSKDQGGTNTTYVDFLRVLAPAGAVMLASDGWERWAPSVTDGRAVFAGGVSIGAGYTSVVHLRYRVPAAVVHGKQYAIHVAAQPGGFAATVQICLAGHVKPTCSAPANNTFDWSSTLAR